MKAIILLFVFFCLSVSLQAQSLRESNSVGVTFSGLGQNIASVPWVPIPRLDGNPVGFIGLGYYSFGITFIRPRSNRFDLEVGVEYNRTRLHRYNMEDPASNRDIHISLIQVPITVRYNFWQYFFLNSGVFLGVNPRVRTMRENMGDMGIILGVGARYDFQNIPVGIFLNPYLKRRVAYLVLETGFRMGVVYNF